MYNWNCFECKTMIIINRWKAFSQVKESNDRTWNAGVFFFSLVGKKKNSCVTYLAIVSSITMTERKRY